VLSDTSSPLSDLEMDSSGFGAQVFSPESCPGEGESFCSSMVGAECSRYEEEERRKADINRFRRRDIKQVSFQNARCPQETVLGI
jgi:hypothetical protein